MKQIPILESGTRLRQGATYLDLGGDEFTATGEMQVRPGRNVVPKDGPLRDVEQVDRRREELNAGTALYAAGVAASIANGIVRARAAIASGEAKRKLEQFVALTQKLGATSQPKT